MLNPQHSWDFYLKPGEKERRDFLPLESEECEVSMVATKLCHLQSDPHQDSVGQAVGRTILPLKQCNSHAFNKSGFFLELSLGMFVLHMA